MRLPAPEISSDPFMELEGRRVICKVDGEMMHSGKKHEPLSEATINKI